jgi:hypothetical protein
VFVARDQTRDDRVEDVALGGRQVFEGLASDL